MAISAVSNAAAAATTVTMPTHATLDFILATVWRNGSTTAPTVPGGWTLIKSQTGTTSFAGVYYKVAASGSETTGTWTGATSVEVNVYRGAAGIGVSAGGTNTGTTITYPALTLTNTDSTSWVFRAAGAKSATNITTNTPTGYTARGGVATPTGSAIRGCDSNGGLGSSPGTGTQTVSGSGVWIALSVELIGPSATSIGTLTDGFSTGSTPDAAKWVDTGAGAGGTASTVAAGVLVQDLPPGGIIAQIQSVGVFDLTGGEIKVQLVSNSASSEADFDLLASGTPVLEWDISGNVADAGGVTPHTHTNGDWYRFRESGGTVFADFSADGSSWTNQFSTPMNPIYRRLTVRLAGLVLTSAPTTLRWDNVNVSPTATNTGAFFAMF